MYKWLNEKIKYENVIIDREQENRDVLEYKRTGDQKIFERLYSNRIPTLKNWAMKHYFPGLAPSIEDFFAELRIIFCKAIQKYELGRGSFNTCLFTFLLNRVKNIKSSKFAKKRVPEGYEGALGAIELSLDYNYGSESGESSTIQDHLESKESDNHESNKMLYDEIIDVLSDGNMTLKNVFVSIGDGETLLASIKEHTMNDKEKFAVVSKKIRHLRKNKQNYMERLGIY